VTPDTHGAVAEAELKKETRPSAREPTSKSASRSVAIFTLQVESKLRYNGDLVYFPKIGTMLSMNDISIADVFELPIQQRIQIV
jgi:hypothetical protein